MDYHAGQFAFIKVQAPGMREPHAFTIASSPQSGRLRFVISELGDWTHRLRKMDLVGLMVTVEGRRLGARDVETEDFDIRQGFGPDRSRDIDDAVRSSALSGAPARRIVALDVGPIARSSRAGAWHRRALGVPPGWVRVVRPR